MVLLSVCIPAYEMRGNGTRFLEHSFNILKKQTFKEFEVVVSDQSDNEDIQNLCNKWSSDLNIKHSYNRSARRQSSTNANNAVAHASGDIVRLLFQDDFLFDENSLETEMVHFTGNQNCWMVSACCHTKDGLNLVNPFYPKYHDAIHYGNNTISSPSVITLKRDSFVGFDENLFWLMDVEFYKRMYDTCGLPAVCNYITAVNREHKDQVSNTIATEEIKKKELEYIINKYK